MDLQALTALTDADLLLRVRVLARDERRATVALVAHLAEVDSRRLYLSQACPSLFVYCTRVLHLSEHEAYNRIEAGRVARRFPHVLAALEAGRVHLTAVRLLAPLLTGENHRELLAQATHKSKREVEEIVARLRPQPDAPSQVRKLAPRRPGPGSVPGADSAADPVPASAVTSALASAVGPAPAPAPAPAPGAADASPPLCPRSPARPDAVVPIAAERYRVQFTVSAALRDKLRRAQELLRHRIPNGDLAGVVELAVDLLVRDLEKKKFAATDRQVSKAPGVSTPSAPAPASRPSALPPPRSRVSRHIPAAVRRAVWERDRGCCAFVSANGVRCDERGGLEFDHIRPYADGGGASVDNVRLLCRSHNQFEAQQFYGLWQADPVLAPVGRCS